MGDLKTGMLAISGVPCNPGFHTRQGKDFVRRAAAMKSPLFLVFGAILVIASGCGSPGRLANPSQNVASQFELADQGGRKSWTWTEPGSPAVLSLEKEGNYELTWAIREKPYADRRRTSIASLLQAPPLPSQGPFGLKEVRFSPSGKTILVHETARDRGRFQTLIFQEDALTGAWKSRKIDLAGEANTKMRKLDDKTKVPAIIAGPQPPTILRLDDKLVIYEVNGKTRSEML
jgi:hypothetical protein